MIFGHTSITAITTSTTSTTVIINNNNNGSIHNSGGGDDDDIFNVFDNVKDVGDSSEEDNNDGI